MLVTMLLLSSFGLGLFGAVLDCGGGLGSLVRYSVLGLAGLVGHGFGGVLYRALGIVHVDDL